MLLLGRLDGSAAFAILDATSPDAARAALGDHAAALGPVVLDAWYATGELERMHALRDRAAGPGAQGVVPRSPLLAANP